LVSPLKTLQEQPTAAKSATGYRQLSKYGNSQMRDVIDAALDLSQLFLSTLSSLSLLCAICNHSTYSYQGQFALELRISSFYLMQPNPTIAFD
jgi:hypothetical protein